MDKRQGEGGSPWVDKKIPYVRIIDFKKWISKRGGGSDKVDMVLV